MILKYKQRAKWMLLIMCLLLIAKISLSVILGVFQDSLGEGLYLALNVIDAVTLLSMLFVVLSGAFLVPYWYGRSKGISSGETIAMLFSMCGVIKLLGMTDKSAEKTDNNQPTQTQ